MIILQFQPTRPGHANGGVPGYPRKPAIPQKQVFTPEVKSQTRFVVDGTCSIDWLF